MKKAIIGEMVAAIGGLSISEVWCSGKQPESVYARNLLCNRQTSQLGIIQTWLNKKLGPSRPA